MLAGHPTAEEETGLERLKPRSTKGRGPSPEGRREDGKDSPSEPADRTILANTLVLDFRPPERREDKCLLFQAARFR